MIADLDRNELLQLLQQTAKEMAVIEDYASKIENLRLQTSLEKLLPLLFPWLIITAFLAIPISQLHLAAGIIIAVVMVSIFLIILKVGRKSDNRKIAQLESELHAFLQGTQVAMIPEDYRSSFALHNLSKYLINYEADTWRECVKIWNKQLHWWQMEASAAEAAEYATAAAKSARERLKFSVNGKNHQKKGGSFYEESIKHGTARIGEGAGKDFSSMGLCSKFAKMAKLSTAASTLFWA